MLKPLGDKIIVKPKPEEDKTAGGIYVPDTAKKKSTEGEVIAVGRGKYVDGKLVEPEVKVGDYIIMHAGFAIQILDLKEAEETLRLLEEIAASEPGTVRIADR